MTEDKSNSLLEMFIFESSQMIEQLETILLVSEGHKNISSENVNEVFRIMHTIKGSAAMMSKTDISSAAHVLEDLFFYIRETKPDIDVSAVCDLTFITIDYIRSKIKDIGDGAGADAEWQDDENFIKTLKSGVEKIKNKTYCDSETEGSDINAAEALKNGFKYKGTVFFCDFCNMVSIRAFMVVKKLREFCKEVTYFPKELEGDDSASGYIIQNGFTVYFNSELSVYELKDIIEEISEVKTAVIQQTEEKDSNPVRDTGAEICGTLSEGGDIRGGHEKNRQNETKQNLISVDLNKLDKLINIVGEIVISESMVTKSPDLAGLNLENFTKAARQLGKLTDELQDLVLSVRMIPVNVIFGKMHRIVRDMCKKLNKEVTLEIIGEDTEVDKNVIDHLSDPLMHLVRNCMDHGIEAGEERIKKGKNPAGKITLEAKYTGGDVIITVSDDGCGLDRQKIINKAKKNGLINKTENLTDKEIYSFILLPGFSTNDEVTEYSGRGVGMDVVKKNIELVRGSINVESDSGKGTTFIMKIPLTLAIIEGMMVKVASNVYIIPTQSIIQSFRPEKGSVYDTQGREMIIIRGECHPVIRLDKLFGIQSKITDYSDGIIIMTEYNDKKICLFADNLLGEQAVVVKKLPDYLSRFKLNNVGIGGCTILGDGSICLILDIAEIADNCL